MATILLKPDKNGQIFFNFPDLKTGDTFQEVQLQIKKPDLSAPDATLSSIRMMFRQGSETGTLTKSISGGSGMTITDATNWIVTIMKFNIDWAVDKYFYDVEITDSNNVIDTVQGGTQKIIQDVTYT